MSEHKNAIKLLLSVLALIFVTVSQAEVRRFDVVSVESVPFIDRAGIVFICSGIAAYVISYLQGFKDNEKATNLDEVSFRTSSFFNIASVIVIMILGVFYATWW